VSYLIAVVIAMAGWLFLMIWIARQLIERRNKYAANNRGGPHIASRP
jgi:hypothetical protein